LKLLLFTALFVAPLAACMHHAPISAPTAAAESPLKNLPAPKRLFRLHVNAEGDSTVEELDLTDTNFDHSPYFIRQSAEYVSIGTMPPGFIIDWHPANQPTVLIPLEGELLVRVKNQPDFVFSPGDILFAEDCQGLGHISGTTDKGAFVATVGLPKSPHCLDASAPPSDPRYLPETQ
jgi:hypothetical protein